MHSIVNRFLGFLKRHTVILRLAMVVVLFTIILRNVHPLSIVAAFRQADPTFLIYALIFMIPNMLIQIFKWKYILRNLTPHLSFKSIVLSVFGGFFLGAASPARTGELARGLFIPGHSRIKIASLTIVDKGFNQIVIIIFGLFSLGFLLPWPLSLIPFISEIFFMYIILNLHRLKPGLERFLNKFTHSERVNNALAAFDALSTKSVLVMFGFSLTFYIIFISQFYILVLCFTPLPIYIAFKTLPVVYLVQLLLPISLGDFGVKEFTTVKLLSLFGISGEFAFSAMFTNNILTFLLPSILGGLMVALYQPLRSIEDLSSNDRTDSR